MVGVRLSGEGVGEALVIGSLLYATSVKAAAAVLNEFEKLLDDLALAGFGALMLKLFEVLFRSMSFFTGSLL